MMKTNIREYNEEYPVVINNLKPEEGEHYINVISEEVYEAYQAERLVIIAKNEGGCNETGVDLIDVLKYTKEHLPEIWNEINNG